MELVEGDMVLTLPECAIDCPAWAARGHVRLTLTYSAVAVLPRHATVVVAKNTKATQSSAQGRFSNADPFARRFCVLASVRIVRHRSAGSGGRRQQSHVGQRRHEGGAERAPR